MVLATFTAKYFLENSKSKFWGVLRSHLGISYCPRPTDRHYWYALIVH